MPPTQISPVQNSKDTMYHLVSIASQGLKGFRSSETPPSPNISLYQARATDKTSEASRRTGPIPERLRPRKSSDLSSPDMINKTRPRTTHRWPLLLSRNPEKARNMMDRSGQLTGHPRIFSNFGPQMKVLCSIDNLESFSSEPAASSELKDLRRTLC